MTAQPSEDVSNSDNTDSQPSYSTDSAAMQHSTFKLQGSKAVGSAQQEVTSPSVAGKTLTHHAKDNAASQTQRDNRPVAEAQVKDANQFPNAQQMQGVSSNHDAQHIGTGDDVTQAPVDAAVLTDAAMEPEEAAQQGQPAAAALPEKAFVDMELIEQVATPSLVQSAEQAQIGWGRVKGYPPWPAQVMTEKAAQPRLSHARRSSVKALPVMFFGTLEVAWLAEKDMVSWSQGLKDKLWDKGRKREAFVLAVQQVTDFVHVNAPRSAPKNWWCRPTALPAAVKNSSKVADGKAAAAKSRTPRSYSARAAQRQAHKPAATAIKPKATAKVKADTAATPHGELKSAELSEAHPATAPAALKQGSKRKHATSVGRQAKRAVDVNFQPAQEESGLNIVKKPGIVERADNAPASAAERSDALQASAPTSTAATAAAAAATAGHSPITSALAAVAGLPADAADVAPSVGFVPAKLTEQAADDAIHAVPPNKRAKTAAGRTASAHDASSLSAFTSRALSDLMEDDVLLEALQDLLAFIGAALPATASTQNAPNADGTSRVDPPQPVIAAPTPAVALLPDQTTAETSSSGLQHNNLHPAGSSMNLLKDGNTNATAATAQAVDRESSAAADTTAPCAMLPASAAVGSAAVGSAAVEHPSNPASGVKHPSEVLSADVHSAGAAGQLSNAGPAPAVVPGSTAQQQSGIVKQAGKRLRGKASVLAKALGLSKSQAVQQRVKSAQQSSAADTNAGIGLQTVCPALQAALAELGVPCQQLQRIDDKLVRELLALQAKETAVASKALSPAALQGLQAVKAAVQAGSVQRYNPLQAAVTQQGPPTHHASALPSQPASQANIPQQLASSQSNYLRDRAPSYVHIPRNVYARGLTRPKRQPKDDIPVCNCTLPQQGGLLAALPARQPTQRQASSSHYKQIAQQAAAANGRIVLTNATDQSLDAEDVEAEQQQSHAGNIQSAADRGTGAAVPQLVQACGEECLNRLSYIRCDAKLCPCGIACSNRPFHDLQSPQVEVFLTDNRGWGVKAAETIMKGTFVVEYAGEVIKHAECERRMQVAKQKGEPHFYMMELGPGLIIDARDKGNVARLINSSCAPNCESQKWHDAATGETRVGIFALRDIPSGEELSYDYQFQHSGLMQAAGAYRCMCGATTCRGTMDSQPERLKDFGKRIEVWWEGDNVFYRGTIVGYSTNARKHTVLYDDNESEKVALDSTPHRWLDENASPHPSPLQPVPDAQGRWQLPAVAVMQDPVGKGSARGRPSKKPTTKKQTGKRKRSSVGLQSQPSAAIVAVAQPAARPPLIPQTTMPSTVSSILAPHVSSPPAHTAAAADTSDKLATLLSGTQQQPQQQQSHLGVGLTTASDSQQQQQQHPDVVMAQPDVNSNPTAPSQETPEPVPEIQPKGRAAISISHAYSKHDAQVLPLTAVKADADVIMTDAVGSHAQAADSAFDTVMQQLPGGSDGAEQHSALADTVKQQVPDPSAGTLPSEVPRNDSTPAENAPEHQTVPSETCFDLLQAVQGPATAQDVLSLPDQLATDGSVTEPGLPNGETACASAMKPAVNATPVNDITQVAHTVKADAAAASMPRGADTLDRQAQPKQSLASAVAAQTDAPAATCTELEAQAGLASPPQAEVDNCTAASDTTAGRKDAQLPLSGLDMSVATTSDSHSQQLEMGSPAAAQHTEPVYTAADNASAQGSNQADAGSLQLASCDGQAGAVPLDVQQDNATTTLNLPASLDARSQLPDDAGVVTPPHAQHDDLQQRNADDAGSMQHDTGKLEVMHETESGHVRNAAQQGKVIIADQHAFTGLVNYADSDSE